MTLSLAGLFQRPAHNLATLTFSIPFANTLWQTLVGAVITSPGVAFVSMERTVNVVLFHVVAFAAAASFSLTRNKHCGNGNAEDHGSAKDRLDELAGGHFVLLSGSGLCDVAVGRSFDDPETIQRRIGALLRG